MDADRRILTGKMEELLQENGVDVTHTHLFVDLLYNAESDELRELCKKDRNAERVLDALIDARIKLTLELFKDDS